MSRTRTNIEIEDTYVRVIMERYGLRTKTDAVELALRHLAGQPMTRAEAVAIAWRQGATLLAHDIDMSRVATIIDLELDAASLSASDTSQPR